MPAMVPRTAAMVGHVANANREEQVSGREEKAVGAVEKQRNAAISRFENTYHSVGSTLLGVLHWNSLIDVFRHVRRTDGQSDNVRFVRVRSEDSCESDGTGNPESCPGKE